MTLDVSCGIPLATVKNSSHAAREWTARVWEAWRSLAGIDPAHRDVDEPAALMRLRRPAATWQATGSACADRTPDSQAGAANSPSPTAAKLLRRFGSSTLDLEVTVGLRTSARLAEGAAAELAHRGRGWFGHRERRARRLVGEYFAEAMNVPAGGVLPDPVRHELTARTEQIIDDLEAVLSETSGTSRSTIRRDAELARQIYALRAAQQHLVLNRSR
jgi:hypothetical protein